MNLSLTPAGRARFVQWLQDVGKPGLKEDAIESDMLDVFTARAAEESMSYELGSQYTNSARPELFFADPADFDPVLLARLVDKIETIWINLDDDLRGTNADPQQVADDRGLLIVVDDDAAMTGPCWWGTAAPLDVGQALTEYRDAGGTVSWHWIPRRIADAPTT